MIQATVDLLVRFKGDVHKTIEFILQATLDELYDRTNDDWHVTLHDLRELVDMDDAHIQNILDEAKAPKPNKKFIDFQCIIPFTHTDSVASSYVEGPLDAPIPTHLFDEAAEKRVKLIHPDQKCDGRTMIVVTTRAAVAMRYRLYWDLVDERFHAQPINTRSRLSWQENAEAYGDDDSSIGQLGSWRNDA